MFTKKFATFLLFALCCYDLLMFCVATWSEDFAQSQIYTSGNVDVPVSGVHVRYEAIRPSLWTLIWKALWIVPTLILSKLGLVSEHKVSELASSFISYGIETIRRFLS